MIDKVAFTGAASKGSDLVGKEISNIVGKYTSPYDVYRPVLKSTNEQILKMAEADPCKKIGEKVEKIVEKLGEHIDYFG